jgi:hypothetical protein
MNYEELTEPRYCWLTECVKELEPQQQRYCSPEHSATYRKRLQRSREWERRTIASLAPEDRALIESVVDHLSYVKALERVAREGERRDEQLVPYRIRKSVTREDESGWVDSGVRVRRDVAECLQQDQAKSNVAKPRRPIPDDADDDDSATLFRTGRTAKAEQETRAKIRRGEANRKPALLVEGSRIISRLRFRPDDRGHEPVCRLCQRFASDCLVFGGHARLRIVDEEAREAVAA